MKSHDVQFRINAGTYKGRIYGYTLASKNGEKLWSVIPRFEPPPSMIKERIEMSLVARQGNFPLSGGQELAQVNKLIDELSAIGGEVEKVTLIGIDKKERLVQIDEDGFIISSVVTETGRDPEYIVNLTCWGLYD
jgi:hypothetical protein